MLVKGTTTSTGARVAAIQLDVNIKQLIFKNCTPITDCLSEEIIQKYITLNKDIYKNIYVLMPIFDLI